MKVKISKDETIYSAAKLAIEKADEIMQDVQFTFNGIELNVCHLSFAGDICEIYDLKCQIRRLTT
jgi:hypothetical protein